MTILDTAIDAPAPAAPAAPVRPRRVRGAFRVAARLLLAAGFAYAFGEVMSPAG